MVHKNILFSCNISFDPLLTRPSSRSLKCNGGNWPIYSLLKLTLVQEYARIKEVLDNRALLRILPSSVHDIFCTFKEIIQFKQINLHPQADMYHPFYSKLSIVNLNEWKTEIRYIETQLAGKQLNFGHWNTKIPYYKKNWIQLQIKN